MPDSRRREPLLRRARVLVVLLAGVLAACDNGTCIFLGSPPYIVPRVKQGTSVTYPFSAYAKNDGPGGGELLPAVVNFHLDDNEAVALTFNPNPAEVPITRAGEVTITAARDALPGVYTISGMCRAKGIESGTTTADFLVEVDESVFFTLLATPASITLDPHEIGSARIDIMRDAGFTEPVTFTVSGVPTGAAVGMSTGPTTGTSVGLSFSAGTAAPGRYPITITGTSVGRVRSVTVEVEILQEVIEVDWSMTVDPMQVTIPSGGSGQVQITLSRTNFPYPVDFFVNFLPPTFGVDFDPQGTTGNSATLTISIPPLTPVGTLPFSIIAHTDEAPLPNAERVVPVVLIIGPPVQPPPQ